MKYFASILFIFLLSHSSALSQVPSWLPIGPGQLKSWATEKIEAASVSIYGPTIIDSKGLPETWYTRKTNESVGVFQQRVLYQKFDFKIADKRDPITVNASLYGLSPDKETYVTLFQGEETAMTQLLSDGKRGVYFEEFDLPLADTILIPGGNITHAQIIYRDEKGVFQWPVTLNVFAGGIEFPTKYEGEQGQLIGWYKDSKGNDQMVAYDLAKSGNKVTPILVTGSLRGAIDNYYEVESITNYTVGDINNSGGKVMYVNGILKERYTPPVVYIKVNKGPHAESLRLTVFGSIIEGSTPVGLPTSATIRTIGLANDAKPTAVKVNPDGSVDLVLAPGEYHLVLDSNLFDAMRPIPDYGTDVPPGNG